MEPSTRPTLVLNADTVIDVDYRLCQRLSLSWAPVTAVLTSLATGQNDEGVLLSSRGEILAFEEGPYSSEVDLGLGPEGGAGAPFLATSHRYLTNAGLYFVNNSRLLQDEAVLRRTGMSWERNALVHYRRSGLLAGITPPVRYVLDVGTPERYERAGRCGPATAG